MIQNSKQYRVTRSQIEKMESVLKIARKPRTKIDSEVHKAMITGILSQLEDMRKELREYEACEKANSLKLGGIGDLSMVLVQARIARGYSQKDLAEKMSLNPQQIQRYEATQYRSASLKRIQDIMRTLQVDIVASIPLRAKKVSGGAAAIQRVSARTV